MRESRPVTHHVALVDCTGGIKPGSSRYAAAVLLMTKNTRLNMTANSLKTWRKRVKRMSQPELYSQMQEIASTIPSSWEFISYTWLIENVSRGFTHQMVRTRSASFAQQTMRMLDMDGFDYIEGPTIAQEMGELYNHHMQETALRYRALREKGIATEDARGILPTNIATNLCVGMNLRAFSELHHKRISGRVQAEFRGVIKDMARTVVEVHPWASLFLNQNAEEEIEKLNKLLSENVSPEIRTKVLKSVDLIRSKP